MSQIQGLPPLPQCFDGLIQVQRTVSETSQGDITEGISHCLDISEHEEKDEVEQNHNNCENGGSITDIIDEKIRDAESPVERTCSAELVQTPISKLNNALLRLKDEMKGLRKLDISLLYQLWTLHEAIQEYKAVMTDQYSDMGSEYSWGGLSSRACSITSIDSCDFAEDFPLQSDPSLMNSLQGSTTSLIQQIEELKVRAETEF